MAIYSEELEQIRQGFNPTGKNFRISKVAARHIAYMLDTDQRDTLAVQRWIWEAIAQRLEKESGKYHWR